MPLDPRHLTTIENATSDLVFWCHKVARDAGWWRELSTGASLLGFDEQGRPRRNIGELLCLVHSEISEAMESARKGLKDDKLPHRSDLEVELADAIIRICDIAGGLDLDIAGALREKLLYNATRADHRPEHRAADGGKKF